MTVTSGKDVVIVQLRNPVGQGEPFPVLRVFDDKKMLRLKRAFFEDTIRQVAEIKDIDIKLAVAPSDRISWAQDAVEHLVERYPKKAAYRSLVDRVEILSQDVAPLVQRTAGNLKHCLDTGYRRAVLVGGFTPTLDPNRVKDALTNLRSHPIILGPTIEGGCYLIGLRGDCMEALGLVTVGSDVAYKKSIAALRDADLHWQEVELSYDIGHQEDLEFVINEINHCRYTGDEDTGCCTESVLAEFIKESGSDDGKRS
jgi:glycosyltransferase A (GT-A) superfamily protein (DUF2064 family)